MSGVPTQIPTHRGPELDAFLERLRRGDPEAVEAVGRLFDELGLVNKEEVDRDRGEEKSGS